MLKLISKGISMCKRILKYISNECYRFDINTYLGLYNKMDDSKFIRRKFKLKMQKDLNLNSPSSFNEKLQWLKLYDRNELYTTLVDKIAVKEYVSKKIGEQYIIPTIRVWHSPKEIDFDSLPDKYVLKCNHNSGGLCICKDKQKFNIRKARKTLEKGMKYNFYLLGREWPYKNVPRKIFAEQYLENSESGGLTDYKIHCFNGKPKFVLVCQDRFAETGLTEDFFTIDWEHMEVKRPNHNNSKLPISKPDKLEEMLSIAEKLSNGIPFVRVDLYFVEGNIFFSELTFFPASGFIPFEPEEWDKTFGDWLVFPNRTEISE